MAPLGIPVPDRTGVIYPVYAEEELKVRLDRLQEKLNNLNENDPSELVSLWSICCEALGLVDQFLYQQERGLRGKLLGEMIWDADHLYLSWFLSHWLGAPPKFNS